jgi:hypothetical protein
MIVLVAGTATETWSSPSIARPTYQTSAENHEVPTHAQGIFGLIVK